MPTPATLLSPEISSVAGRTVVSRQRAVAVPAGQVISIGHAFVDARGDPLNLSALAADDATVKFRVNDAVPVSAPSTEDWDGAFLSAADGTVTLPLDATHVAVPAILTVDVAVFTDADPPVMAAANRVVVYVDRSAWSTSPSELGPPAVREARLHLRDSGPEDNMWLDDEEFDLAELAAGVEKCVRWWNESLPQVQQLYSTATYPWRLKLLDGATAYLYKMAARHYRRVHLPYQAGGLSVDDKNKAAEYEAIGSALWQEFVDWTQGQKVKLNAEAAYGSLSSGYVAWDWYG